MALSKEEQERIKKLWENRHKGGSTDSSNVVSSGTGSSMLSDNDKDRIKQNWSKRFDVDDTFINTFISDANDFLNNAQTNYNKLDYKTATAESSLNYYKAMRETEDDLGNRAWKIQNYLKSHKNDIDEETYTSLSSFLDNFSSPKFSQLFFDARDYYSKWETEEDEKAAREKAEADAKRWEELTGGYDPTENKQEGQAGWEDYLATQERIAQNLKEQEEDKGFWEKLLGYLGEIGQDTSLPLHNTVTISQGYIDQEEKMKKPDERWTEDQKLNYGYLWKQSRTSAAEYAYAVNNMLNTKQEQDALKKIMEFSTGNFWQGAGATIGAIATSPLGLADYLGDVIAQGTLGYIPESDGTLTPFEYSQAVTGSIAQHLNTENGTLDERIPIIGGKGWGDAYSLGTSIAQSSLAGFSGGSGQALVTFFGSAAAAGVDDALSRGANGGQAVAYGSMLGLAEGLAENIGVDNLMKIGSSKTVKQLVLNLLKQGAAEGIEEGVTSVMNNFADNLIMGDKSNFNILVTQYMAQGLSEEEAKKKAWLGMAEDIAFDMVGGFVSGAIHAGPQTAYQTYASNYNPGNTIMKADGGVDALKNLANEVAGVSDSKMKNSLTKLAGKVSSDVATGSGIGKVGAAIKNANNAVKVGKLYNTVNTANNTLNKADVATILEMRRFDSATANELADAIVAVASGNQITEQQAALLKEYKDNEDVMGVINGYDLDERSTIGKRNKAMSEFNRDIKTGLVVSELKSTTAKAFTPDGKFKVSKTGEATKLETEVDVNGKTITKNTGDVIDIKRVYDVRKVEVDGKEKVELILELSDGSTINAENVAYANESDALIYETIANLGENINAETANRLIAKYDGSNAEVFARGMAQAYTYGFYGIDRSEMTGRLSLATELTEEQRNFAYGIGEKYRGEKDARDKANARDNLAEKIKDGKAKAPGEKGVYYRDKDGNSVSIEDYLKNSNVVLKTDAQRTGIEAMRKLAETLGVRINVFESWKENGKTYYLNQYGKKVEGNPNGFYDTITGEIYIALDAGSDYSGTMLFTIAHELTHFMRQWSPEHFTEISKIVFAQSGFKGDVSAMIALKQKNAKEKGKPISYDVAMEEVVADAMETILKDGKVFEFMQELKQQNRSAWEKVKGWFKNLAKFLRKMVAAYSGKTANSVEGRKLAAFSKDLLNQIEQIWAEGAVSAGENYQAALESVVESNAEAVSSDEIITDGAVVTDGEGTKFSIKSMKHDIADGQMFEDLKTYCGWTQKQVNELRQNLENLVEYMTPFRDILDMNETYGMEGRRFSPYKPNSDPLYKISMDFSTLCSKRLLTQYVIENLQLRENRPMSAEEQMAIRDMLNEYRKVEKGLQVACAMCYVEAARLKSPKQIQRWLNDPAPLLRDYFGKKNKEFNDSVKEAQADFKESRGYARNAPKKDMKQADVKELNKIGPKMRAKYQLSAEEQAIIDKAKTLPNSTYLTAGNLSDLSETDPVIYDAYTAFVRTATRSKSLETDEPYYYGDSRRDNGNGIVVSDSFIEAVNRENGMRFSSWSDWRIQHLLDYITAVIDNSVRGAAMHGYTKFGDEVRVLGKTGMMFNMSGVAGTQTGLNEDGSLSFSPTESIDVNEAIQLREEFPEHAGLQCIGVSDAHIIALLRSDIIDYVIPYHVSGLNAALRRMADIYGWDDYTGTQHASIDKSIKKENAVDPEHWHEEPVFSEFFVGYDTGMSGIEAMRASAERYKQMCKDRGLTPKFNQFANEANYWKLLIDRKMINQQTGNLIRQKAVTPTFDFNTIKGVVDRYVDNYDSGLEARALNHIVENWDSIPKRIKDLKKQGGTKAKKTKKAVGTLANQTLAAQPVDNTKFSERVTDKKTLDRLNKEIEDGEYITVYRSFQVIDGGLYAPMNAVDRDENGKNKRLGYRSMLGVWEKATESPEIAQRYMDKHPDAPWASFDLDGVDNKTGGVAYNPYLHASNLVLNDQFAAAYRRNLVTVECRVPKSEIGAHHAKYAKDTTGWVEWKPGGVAGKLMKAKPEYTRQLFVSRYMLPVRIIPDSEVAQMYKEYLDGTNIAVPWNVVTPSLRKELVKAGVKISYKDVKTSKYTRVFSEIFPDDADEAVRYSDRDNAPTFYSHMARVVDAVKQEKLGAASVVSMLRGKGVKAEEIKWSGIEEWLAGKKSVTKAELQEFIAGSMLQIEEDVRGGGLGVTFEPVRTERHRFNNGMNVILDGEIIDIVTWDGTEGAWRSNNLGIVIGRAEDVYRYYGKAEPTNWEDYKLDGGTNYRELVFKLPGSEYTNHAMQAHWGKDAIGILAHARVQDFDVDGKKMLFIEEIQSDWHNDGHAKGYESAEYKEAERVSDELFNEWQKVRKPFHQYVRSSEFNTDPEDVRKKKFDWLRSKVEAAEKKWQEAERYVESLREKGAGTVPDAPFKDTYHEYVVKRLLRMAAEEGYDSIGWTPAQIQVERWSEEFAEGYRIEYDQDIPKFLKKYGKKWGAEVGKTLIDEGKRFDFDEDNLTDDGELSDEWLLDDSELPFDGSEFAFKDALTYKGTEVWTMPITSAMKESVMTEGQPLYSDRVLMGSLFSGGGTLEAGLVYQMLDKEFAVEYEASLASIYADNHGKDHLFVGDVRDFDSKGKQNVFYLHASPVCKNFSPASHSGGETTTDITTAQATARVLEEQMPQVFTVENVKRYKGSEAYTIITDKLTELGYKWDVDVYKASDYGNATKRERMIIRAVKDGDLPAKPAKVSGITSWGEATRDLWETDLIPSTLVKSKIEAIRNTPALKNLKLTKLDRPLMIYDTNKSKQVTYAWADELAPTLTTKCGDARIIMPDGRVYEPTPKFMGRIQGLPDDYKYPKAKTNAFKIIGNGIPTQLTKAVIGGVLDSAYEQTHDGQVLYQDRAEDSVSNRSLLANALEGVAKPEELQKIQEYKDKVALINAEEKKLRELNEQIKELSFAKGPRDNDRIKALRFDANQTANRINTYDKQLLRLEASKPLQDVLDREKKKAYQRAEKRGKEALDAYREKAAKTQRALLEKWQESRKKAVESREKTAMKHKIQSIVGELNQLLLNDDKKRHVPDSLKKAVADALALVNMDTVGAEERAAKYAALIAKETDPDKIDAYTVTMENILRQGEKMGQRLKELRDAYEEIQNSDDPDIANGYDPVISGCIKELAESIGNTSLKDMSIEQLEDVYSMYKMVLTRVRDANKSLIESIKENISSRASAVIGQVRDAGGEHKDRASILDPVKAFFWNNAKPVYAMERIGSSAFTEAYNNVRKGEDTWAKDVTEARAYYLDKSNKYGYDSWDFDKKYTFKSTSDIEFELTLEQMMALYAYSKRDQAFEHLRLGGFVFDSNIETYKETVEEKDGKVKKKKSILKYKVNTADAHQLTPETLASIISTIEKEAPGAKDFVDEMQDYLSTVMGAKGNEVTMKMYGVKLFKEKFYFPLKSAKQFMFEQNEVSGEVKIKNSGFTNKTKPKANNPIILNNFMDVWANHVNDMSMYHSFVLPLEDFNRIFNYNSPKKEGVPPVSVKGTIQSAYSPAAVSYVKQLITDLNGGAMSDPRETFAKTMMSKFKKAKVFSSLSVVIQQPSAIGRAFALVDPKYFRPTKDGMNHEELWSELKQYAPVAVIKEMGYFDTNMGKSTLDFIKAKEYSTFKEKAKAIFTDEGYRDEKLSRLPALADELTWCAIWNAVKRETVSTYKDLRPGSEEFLKVAGERFTEVVTKTQVYDSVLARSANMRSKSGLMSMVTSFMAEPTTSINMLEDAILKGKRGNKRYASRAFASVAVSVILNNALVALVYGARDDDDDETFAEKYMQAFVSGMIDDLNPLTYYPYLKDMWSLLQGYDIERADMSLVSDLADAMKGMVQAYTSEDGDAVGAWHDMAGTIANIGGVPMQNISRDINGAINFFSTVIDDVNGRDTTWGSMGDALEDTVKDSLPVVGWFPSETKADKLYDAIISGDTAYVNRLKGSYKTEDAYHNAVRKALRENDPRIKEAAIAGYNGNPSERVRIAKLIIADGFDQDDVVAAINAEVNDMKPDEPSEPKKKGFYTASDFATEIANGDQATAYVAKEDIIATAQKNGKTAEEAKKSFVSSAKTELKKLFKAGSISEQKLIDTLVNFCDMEYDDAEKYAGGAAFEVAHPELDGVITYTQYQRWESDGQPRGVPLEMFVDVASFRDDGTSNSVKSQEEVALYISSVTSDTYLRDALWCCFYNESTLKNAPWH